MTVRTEEFSDNFTDVNNDDLMKMSVKFSKPVSRVMMISGMLMAIQAMMAEDWEDDEAIGRNVKCFDDEWNCMTFKVMQDHIDTYKQMNGTRISDMARHCDQLTFSPENKVTVDQAFEVLQTAYQAYNGTYERRQEIEGLYQALYKLAADLGV